MDIQEVDVELVELVGSVALEAAGDLFFGCLPELKIVEVEDADGEGF